MIMCIMWHLSFVSNRHIRRSNDNSILGSWRTISKAEHMGKYPICSIFARFRRKVIKKLLTFCYWRYISWEMTPTSIGGEKQAGISGGSQSPSWYSLRQGAHCPVDNGFAPTETECRLAEVRSRSVSCNCMTRTSQQECRGILESVYERKEKEK